MKSITRRILVTNASAFAMLAGLAPAQAQVATPVQNEEVGAEIVVTGTNIRGTEVVGSVVQSLTAEDIARTGKATIADLLRELPANFAGGVANSDNSRGGQDTSPAGANLTGGAGVNLRGLGALSTLVLVNGRRVAASGQFGDFVDISNIPVAAIERIEILQDGASAVYGSDAVGGVVNIVLKKRVNGLQALGRIGTLTQGGEMEYQGSLTGGASWSGGHAVLGYEYNRRDNVLASERNFNGGDFSDRGGVNWPRYTGRAGAAANIFSAGAAFNGNVVYTVPQGPGTGLTVARLTPATGGFGNSFDPWAMTDIVPRMERHSVFGSVEQSLGAVDLHASARYTRRRGGYNTGYLPVYNNVPATNPAFIAGTTNNFGVLIDDFATRRDVSADSYAAEAGVAFRLFGDWRFDATGSYSREDQGRNSQLVRDSNVAERLPNGTFAPSSVVCSLAGLTSANIGSIASPTPQQTFCAGLNYQTFNPYSTEPLSAAVLNQLVGYEDLSFKSDLIQGTAKVDGTLIDLPGGGLKLAMGVDWRRERISGELNYNYRSINPQQVPYGETRQNVFAAFAEAALPIFGPDNARPGLEALDLSAAVRYERSEGLRDFSTTNPKFGFRYAPTRGFNIRGSWGTSFHAPPMRFQYDGYQPVPGGNAIFYNNAAYTAPCNTTLVTLNGFTGTPGSPTGSCTFTGAVVVGGAGPTLRPERAETWTLGVDFAPPTVPGLSLSIGYFNLEVKDRLVRITAGQLAGILAGYFATGSSPYSANLVFNPTLAQQQALFADPRFIGLAGAGPTRVPGQIGAIIYATQSNLASLKMDGIDMSARYGFDSGIGRIELFGNGSLVTTYDLQATPTSAFVDRLGVYESTGNPVEFKAKGGVSLTSGGFTFVGTTNYVSSYKCTAGCYVPSSTGAPVLATQPLRIGSWTTFDFQIGYRFAEGGLLGGTGLTLNILNAFDKDPPYIDTGRIVTGNAPEPYDAANANILGRSVALTLTKSF